MYGFLCNPLLRRVALFDISFEGYTIPQGTPVMLPVNSYNFLEENFPEAVIFKPERFLKEGVNYQCDTPNYTFGVGHHTCPGSILARMMLKLVAVVFLDKFNAISDEVQSFKPSYPRGKPDKETRLHSVLTTDTFYFPVPEDLLRYNSFTARALATKNTP